MSSSTIAIHPEYGEVTITAKFVGFWQVKDSGGIIRRVDPGRLSIRASNSSTVVQSLFPAPEIPAQTIPTEAPNINDFDANTLASAANISRVVARKILSAKPEIGFSSLEHLRELVGDVALTDGALERLGKLRYETRQSESEPL